MWFGVSPEKQRDLERRMAALGLRETDLDEKFVRGSGPGGQKKNKASTCVHLRHRPSGLEVKCQRERSQAINRFLARRELCERLEALRRNTLMVREQELARIRRQKRRRSRRQKAKMLAEKRHRAAIKAMRSAPNNEEV